MSTTRFNWKNYLLQLFSVFLGVTLAFSMDTCSNDRQLKKAEKKTLLEIQNGLAADLADINMNIFGHNKGLESIEVFRDLVNNKPVLQDSIGWNYRNLLRDYITIQNSGGYESLKSRGLELIENDSLRLEIINMYDFFFEIIQKLEEDYSENQFNQNYYKPMNDILSRTMEFDENGTVIAIRQPIQATALEKKQLMSYLWRIEYNRKYTIRFYKLIRDKIITLNALIDQEIKN